MENQDLKTRVEDLEYKLAQISDAYYKYNFQGSQAITKDTTVQSGLVQSGNFKTGVDGWRIQSNGDAEFNNGTFRGTLTADTLILGASRTVTITPTDDIQAEINALNALGGGVLRFSAGTYTINSDITSYTDISFQGDVMSDTILDFNNTGANINISGTGVYTTGTITSIASGVNVTGSGTSWLANASAGQYIFLGTRWYLIAAVTSDTTLILAEGYSDDLTMPGLAYRIATPVFNVAISGLTIKNSTDTAVVITDGRQIAYQNITFLDNSIGFKWENVSHTTIDNTVSASNSSHGAVFVNCGLLNPSYFASVSNGGSGIILDNVKTGATLFCSSTGNTLDGYNCTNVKDCVLKVEASGNQSNGIEFVSGCDNNFINDSLIRNNASDGIKLTATSDNNTIGSAINIIGNGGYGVNIAANTCTTNTLLAPFFADNSLGDYNDNGTGTRIISGQMSDATEIVASNNLKVYADTEETISNASYTLTKRIMMRYPGVVRVKFDLVAGAPSGAYSAFGRIYVNGIAIGTERINGTTTYQTYSEDIRVQIGDYVDIFTHYDSSNPDTKMRNFRIYYDLTTTTTDIVIFD